MAPELPNHHAQVEINGRALYLSRSEAAKLMGMTPPTMLKACKEESIRTYQAPGSDRWMISATDVERWLRANHLPTDELEAIVLKKQGKAKPLLNVASLNANGLTTREASQLFGVSPRTMATWMDAKLMDSWVLPTSNDRRVSAKSLYIFAQKHGMPVTELEKLYPEIVIAHLGDKEFGDTLDTHLPHQREGQPMVESPQSMIGMGKLMARRMIAAVLINQTGLRNMNRDLRRVVEELNAGFEDTAVPPYVFVGDDKLEAADAERIIELNDLPVAFAVDRNDPENAATRIMDMLHWKPPERHP
jgi:excisionase family DNA binding protein